MNRGRHKNIKIPYNARITLRCYFAYNEIVCYDYIRTFRNMKQLNYYAFCYLNADTNIKKIEILYNGKLIKTY